MKILTEHDKWIQARIEAVTSYFSAFEALSEYGLELIDKSTDQQIQCPLPGHGPDNRPSARYYAGSDHTFYCFKCKSRLNGVGLYAKFKGLRFMEALQDLERRYRIKIPRRPEAPEFTEPVERGANYVSDAWGDVTRLIPLLEGKLQKLRGRVSLTDFVKFCRVIDAVSWDFEKNQNKSTPDMVAILNKLRLAMDKVEDEANAIDSMC